MEIYTNKYAKLLKVDPKFWNRFFWGKIEIFKPFYGLN